MAIPIVPQLIRGRLYFQIADVLFPTFAAAASACSAAVAHRIDIVDVGGASTVAKLPRP